MGLVAAWAAACGEVEGSPDAQRPADAAVADGAVDAAVAGPCDLGAPFGDIQRVGGVNTAQADEFVSLSPDELTLYLASNRADPGTPNLDLYVATRSSRGESFSAPVAIDAVNSGSDDRAPEVSADGKALFFHSSRSGGYDVYVSTRANTAAGFAAPVSVAGVNSADIEGNPGLAADGETLYFGRYTNNVPGVWRATRGPAGYGSASPVEEINTPNAFWNTTSPDDLAIFFASDRDGGRGGADIYVASRASRTEPFGHITNVAELNTDKSESPDWISPDGCRIYFSSDRPGSDGDFDVWQASRPAR